MLEVTNMFKGCGRICYSEEKLLCFIHLPEVINRIKLFCLCLLFFQNTSCHHGLCFFHLLPTRALISSPAASALPPTRFIGMKFKAVTFIDSSFLNCYFEDVSSVGSSFNNCTFVDSFFYNTGERACACESVEAFRLPELYACTPRCFLLGAQEKKNPITPTVPRT